MIVGLILGIVCGILISLGFMVDGYRAIKREYKETQLTRIADKLEKIERKLP